MAAYPSFAQLEGSVEERQEERLVDFSINGVPKVRLLSPGTARVFTVKHNLIAADRTTWDNFYAANWNAPVTFTWNATGETLTCIILQVKVTDVEGGFSEIESRLAVQ